MKSQSDGRCYLTTTDNNYVPHLLAMFASLADVDNEFPFFLAHLDLSRENQILISDYASSVSLTVTLLHVTDVDLSDYERCGEYPPVGWLKFYLDCFLPANFTRVMFIDPDTIVLKPLSPIFELGMQSKPMAAVIDMQDANPEFKQNLGLTVQDRFFNSGVILFDMPTLTRHQIG